MTTMCHSCDLECSNPCSDEKIAKSSTPNGHHQECKCKSFPVKFGEESSYVNGFSPYSTPLMPSPSTHRSCGSSSGEIPVDMNIQISGEGEEALDTGQMHKNQRLPEHMEEHGNGSLYKDIDIHSCDSMTIVDGLKLSMATEENYTSSSVVLENIEICNSEKAGSDNSGPEDFHSTRAGDDSDGAESGIENNKPSFLPIIETDPLLWEPPEPEDMEDEIDSVANDDEDDDYIDGRKWGKPTSLSSLNEHGNSHSYKEERQNAMMGTMNGQFKVLVGRFLASEGLASLELQGGEGWRDIVASLSWEAALLIKPDVGEGRGMDPGSYVKVKCVASGVRSQSQVIKGLVFKKNTAHKHMPTKFKSPRLLLLRGVLGTSAAVLSSFDSMGQEKDFLKSIIEVIDTCHPNVVLVEKTVSRDIQESLVSKGITLVFDMKLPRLERIARCTGSQIVSCADLLLKPKLKHCDFFHVEKFVEEHNTSGEGGKRPCKTLMFLEGCPKPLGCTILLRGAHCDELKKVKRLLQYTVFAAYHLIMETSFFADQRAFFSDVQADQILPSLCDNAPVSNLSLPDDSAAELSSAKSAADTELKASSSHIDGGDLSDPSAQPLLSGHLLSSVSSSLKSFLGDRFPSINSHSISSYFSFEEKEIDSRTIDSSMKTDIHDSEENPKHIEGQLQHVSGNSEVTETASHTAEIVENGGVGIGNKVQVVNKNDIESVLDPQSILILLATQCITKGVVCEPSHLTRIKYYGNFDLSLGRYLQDILLNKKHSCNSCGEPPEAHVYSYTHQNGRLNVLVKQLPLKSPLPGEAEGKIWMWTRCLKCAHEKGIPRSTRRVVMSTAARGLSFGKFLELSFSSNSAATRLSRCGHLLHRDCLRFFGLGSKVAMFRYSAVEIYAACKPPSVLEFYNPIGQELVNREAREVIARVNGFFSEVWDVLQELKLNSSSFCKNRVKVHGSLIGIHEVEEMLLHEKADFEVSLQKASNHIGETSKTKDEVLNLNWLKQELLLEVFVWDHRLDYLISCARDSGDATYIAVPEPQLNDVNLFTKCDEINVTENGDKISEITIPISVDESFSSCGSQHALNKETEMDSKAAEAAIFVNNKVHESMDADIVDMECSKGDLPTGSMTDKHTCMMDQDPFARRGEFDSIVDHMQADHSIPVISVPVDDGDRASDIGRKIDTGISDFDMSSVAMVNKNHLGVSKGSENTKNEDPEGWIWTPFSELRRAYRKDLRGGYLQKYGHVYSYKPSHISLKHELISQEIDSLHFTIGLGGNVMSVSEHEISSIIAYALAVSEEQSGLLGKSDFRGQGESDKAIDKSYSLTSEGSVASSYWSSIGSVDSEGMPSAQYASSLTSDELSTLFSDGPLFVDRLVSLVTPESVHPEIPVGISKIAGKSKYSVVCVYAKEFYDLRRRCCPSEMAYISSLSHCKKWDAQGGKSKSIFAKSLDDRFIIKQIKKTEFDSFLKFAPDYFKHVTMSLDSGSQTCLAKILGIYQIRQNKGGKEVKVDLMVMENLLYGRNIACIYDLKGAVFSRYVPGKNDPDKVLLDENFIEDMRLSPIYIGGRSKLLLQRAVWNDTAFLTSINVMDYSLLVGVDKERHELVFGIIDYLRQYTWDKQLETWVKSSLVVPKNELPTVISPKEYKKRFRKFMAKHFLTVPDTWSSEPCCAPFKVNGDSDGESSNIHSSRQSELLNSV